MRSEMHKQILKTKGRLGIVGVYGREGNNDGL